MCRLSVRPCLRAEESLSANVGLQEAASWDGLLSGTAVRICHTMGLVWPQGEAV